MTHNEKRGSAFKEGQLALFTGSLFGGAHTISGHPLDTIKSKMQIQTGFTQQGAYAVAKRIYSTEGLRGFFRGCIPPLWGSMIYRGVMMSAYEYAFTYVEKNYEEDSFWRQELVLGVRPLVPAASGFAGFIRSFIESPIEYAKVMGQTGKQWKANEIYRGFGSQALRSTILLMPIFTLLDIFRRHTDMLKTLPGNFAVTFGASSIAYLVCWPLETLKNLSQTGTPYPGASTAEKIKFLGGPSGLFRGVSVGVVCGGLRNGCGMMAMVYAQAWATQLGLRD